MQFLAHMLMGIYLFFLCISAGFWYIGTELENAGVAVAGSITGESLDMDALASNYTASLRQYQTENPFNTAFIFGDFGAGLTKFVNIISGGYALDMLQKLGFPESFQTIAQVTIVGFGTLGAAIYIISGRG